MKQSGGVAGSGKGGGGYGRGDVLAAVHRKETAILWIETPSNPLMKISDIARLAEIGHAAGAIVVVDNTFASPYLQQPIALGADAVVHSTTKYLGGHSDVLGGAVIVNDDQLAAKVGFLQGASGPEWLDARGIPARFVTPRGKVLVNDSWRRRLERESVCI